MGDIFEEIAERVALARTRALMGERQEALTLFQCARLDYLRFREVLRGYPGSLALEHAIETTTIALCEERTQEREELPEPVREPFADGSSKAA